MDALRDDSCIGCVKGKTHEHSHTSTFVYWAKEKLEFVHADLCGPFTPMSLSGKKFCLVLVDGKTTIKSVYFMKVARLKHMVELETGLKIKRLRTDRRVHE